VNTSSSGDQAGPAASRSAGLEPAVAAQSGHGARVEGDPAGASGSLRLRELEVVVDHDEGLTDCEPAAVQVEVSPAQPEDFAAAHAVRAASRQAAANRSSWTLSRN
jgi:hypothetical protein